MGATRTSFYIEADLQQGLRQAARRLGKTQTLIVSEALADYLAKVARPELGAIGKGADSDLDARDAKRWVRRRWAGNR
jgi:predicted transcriptional regulator